MQKTVDGGTWDQPTDEEKEADRQSNLDYRASQVGSVLTILGAIIWGYGDLVGKFFNGIQPPAAPDRRKSRLQVSRVLGLQ